MTVTSKPKSTRATSPVRLCPRVLRPRWVVQAKGGATVDRTQDGSLVKTLLLNAASLLHLTDRSTSQCIQCRGKGEIVCPKCKGSTTHGVHSAGGLKTNRCLTCHGHGLCVCPQCKVGIAGPARTAALSSGRARFVCALFSLALTRPHSPSLALTRTHSPSLALTRTHSPSLALTRPHSLFRWRRAPDAVPSSWRS